MHEATLFGDWLRHRRKALDFTLELLAQRVGCSSATITKIESGLRRPSQQIAERLADALAIPAEERDAFVRRARRVPAALPALPTIAAPSPAAALPTPLTPLIGRAAEVQAVVQQFERGAVRLLTLTGPPGVGKTHLAIEIARRASPKFADDVAFVSLAAVRDPALVLEAIAQALGVQAQADVSAHDLLVLALRERQLLLVLDTFEQVTAAAPQLARLLGACPLLAVLVTSRERLHVRGERQVRVLPLPMPDPDALADPALVGQFPAVELFVEVAQTAAPGFVLTAENARAVATICARLDGLPLAIELAAAHSDTLPPQALLARLEQQRPVGAGPRDLPERQQTLRATIDWSYDLLTAGEQRLLARLAAFSGALSLDAAQQVCGAAEAVSGEPPLADQLAALINKSLVQQRAQPVGEAHVALMETIRAYALERLRASGEERAIRSRHADYYHALADQIAPQLTGGEQRARAEQLRLAHDNLAAALGWLLEQGDAERAGQLCKALRRFWWMAGRWREGRAWAAAVLARRAALSPLTLAHTLIVDGTLAQAQGNLAEAAASFESALALAHNEEHRETIGIAAHNLGSVMLAQGNYERGRALLEMGLQIDREAGDSWGLAISLGSLAELAYYLGDDLAAREHYQESLAIFRERKDYGSVASGLGNLAEILRWQGDLVAAQAYLAEALALVDRYQLRRVLPYLLNSLSLVALLQRDVTQARQQLWAALAALRELASAADLATSLAVGALIAWEEGNATLAATLLGAAQAVRLAHGVQLAPREQAEFDAQRDRVQAALGHGLFDTSWDAGQRLSAAAALEVAHGA